MYTVLRGRKRYLARRDEDVFRIDDFAVVNKLETGRVKMGTQEVVVLESNLNDYLLTLRRKAQIITLKDSAYLIARCGIRSGMRVVEAGAGSGALSTVLLYFLHPDGELYTYELREDFARIARENVERMEHGARWELKIGDVRSDVEERDVDAFILDIPEPWEAVEMAKEALKKSGCFAAYVPTYNQLERTYRALEDAGFVDLEACEVLKRDIVVGPLGTRPANIEVAHTGFMLFARKV